MRRLPVVASVVLWALLAHGCKHSGELPALQRQQQERDQIEALKGNLDEAKTELTELRAAEAERRAAELGVPTGRELLTDLGAASLLLAQARARIEAGEAEPAADLLGRARDVLSFASARLPRAQVAVRLARAASMLPVRQGGATGGLDRGWETARLHVEEARILSAGARSRPMHVEVDAELQTLLDVIDKGDARQAQANIAELLRTKLAPTEGEILLERTDWCIGAGLEALGRNGLSAAAGWIADAQRDIGKIVTGLGGTPPAWLEEAVAGPVPAQQSPTRPPPAPAPEKPAPSSKAPAEPAPEGKEEADAGAQTGETEAPTASENAEGETDKASN